MTIGTRMTVATTALVMVALFSYGFASVRIRRGELRDDLERQSQALGGVLQVSLEAALQEGLFEDVRRLVYRVQESVRPVRVAYVELRSPPPPPEPAAVPDGGGRDGGAEAAAVDDEESRYVPPPPDPMRDERVRHAQQDGQPFGQHLERDGRRVYAYTVPLRDAEGHVPAVIDLERDEADAERALLGTVQNVAATVVLLSAGLALLVWLLTQRAISNPLQRLVEGIDEVSQGDLTRVILREREDEIGDLAERFNRMTENLREARVETERSVEARLLLEARLRHSEKLATVGQLAAQIAHEVGTPLGVIGGRARTMEKKAADPLEVQKNAGIIAGQAARITKIIQRLLDMARKKLAVRAAVDLGAVARDTVDFLEHQLAASRVTVRLLPWEPDADPAGARAPRVIADADELQQVTLNLLLNAMQAMPDGGRIEIRLRGRTRRKPGLDLAPPARYVEMEVADEGVGIPPEDRERIFEPFYSTKQDLGGTGLGLAVTLGIVKDSDGWMEIDGGSRGGSLFRVFLPAADAVSAPPSPGKG